MTKRIQTIFINYIYEIKQPNKNNKIYNTITTPFIELYRSDVINGLIKRFYYHVKKLKLENADNCFNHGKLLEMVHRWCWDQYYKDSSNDWVIPYLKDNNYDYEMFLENINYINASSINITFEHIKNLDKNIFKYLTKTKK